MKAKQKNALNNHKDMIVLVFIIFYFLELFFTTFTLLFLNFIN